MMLSKQMISHLGERFLYREGETFTSLSIRMSGLRSSLIYILNSMIISNIINFRGSNFYSSYGE